MHFEIIIDKRRGSWAEIREEVSLLQCLQEATSVLKPCPKTGGYIPADDDGVQLTAKISFEKSAIGKPISAGLRVQHMNPVTHQIFFTYQGEDQLWYCALEVPTLYNLDMVHQILGVKERKEMRRAVEAQMKNLTPDPELRNCFEVATKQHRDQMEYERIIDQENALDAEIEKLFALKRLLQIQKCALEPRIVRQDAEIANLPRVSHILLAMEASLVNEPEQTTP